MIPIDDVSVRCVVERLNDFELNSDNAFWDTRLFGKLCNFVIVTVGVVSVAVSSVLGA